MRVRAVHRGLPLVLACALLAGSAAFSVSPVRTGKTSRLSVPNAGDWACGHWARGHHGRTNHPPSPVRMSGEAS